MNKKQNVTSNIMEYMNSRSNKKFSYNEVSIILASIRDEYQDRTGRCAFGFKEVRTRLGYNPDTGLEIL